MLRKLRLNIPLLEALEQMPGYTRFMKQLVIRKKRASIDDDDGVHHCSAVMTRSFA